MVVDQLGVRGIDVQPPADETWTRLAEAGVSASKGRIVDLTLAGTRYDVMSAALRVLRTAPEFDLVVAVAGSSARFAPELVVRPIIDSGADAPGMHPLSAFVVPEAPETLLRLTEAGVPCFRTPEACADAIAAVHARRAPKAALPRMFAEGSNGASRLLDELDAYRLLGRVGVAHAPAIAVDASPDAPLPDSLPYPLAVKVLSADVPHKTDAGGVELGIANAGALRDAIDRIRASVQRHDPTVEVTRVLVQPMTRGLGEALVGYRVDPQIGPVVMLAAGGVLTEIYRDRALRTAPVDRATALDMIAEVKGFKALAGYRGKPRGDLDALADLIVAVSKLATLADARILEAEVNPVMVLEAGKGVLAVDALVRLVDRQPPAAR
jgi:acyl-CoA synthetase (NDP forming)